MVSNIQVKFYFSNEKKDFHHKAEGSNCKHETTSFIACCRVMIAVYITRVKTRNVSPPLSAEQLAERHQTLRHVSQKGYKGSKVIGRNICLAKHVVTSMLFVYFIYFIIKNGIAHFRICTILSLFYVCSVIFKILPSKHFAVFYFCKIKLAMCLHMYPMEI